VAEDAPQELLSRVIHRYLESGDFNGLFVAPGSEDGNAAEALIRAGQAEVISDEDFPNPHIRPWSSMRSAEEQIKSVRGAIEGASDGVCLYPTALALADRDEIRDLADSPYTQRLAAGGGQLDIAYFRMDVLEAYRNDPRFHFVFNDFGAKLAVTDETFEDEHEDRADKVSIRLGFAYRHPLDKEGRIDRFVAVFLYDLSHLSPEHQRRWETYEVRSPDLQAHPIWLAEGMGHWIDRIGPFDALFAELAALDALFKRAFGTTLFATTRRPDEFGWILRASQLEFDAFVHTLDKLLSENLRHDAFNSAGIDRKDELDQPIGTLNQIGRASCRERV
jgi:hypothetical protein